MKANGMFLKTGLMGLMLLWILGGTAQIVTSPKPTKSIVTPAKVEKVKKTDVTLPSANLEAATLIYPEKGQIDVPVNITFSWEKSKVPNVTYGFYLIARSQILQGQEITPVLVADNLSTNSFQYTLRSGEQYWWHVKVNGSDGKSLISGMSYFITINQPPTVPVLISPTNNDTLYFQPSDTELTLRWQPSTDPNGNTISYNVNLGYTSDLHMNLKANENTFYIIEIPVSQRITTYYWRIEAIDLFGAKSASETRRIVVIRR